MMSANVVISTPIELVNFCEILQVIS